MIDAKSNGNWFTCVTVEVPSTFEAEWAKKAHIGITASTGQLAGASASSSVAALCGAASLCVCFFIVCTTFSLLLLVAHGSLAGRCRLCADNHDVVSLSTYDDLGIHPEADDLIVTPKFGRSKLVNAEHGGWKGRDVDGCLVGLVGRLWEELGLVVGRCSAGVPLGHRKWLSHYQSCCLPSLTMLMVAVVQSVART